MIKINKGEINSSSLMLTQLPWDWSNFVSSVKDGLIEFDENGLIKEIDRDTVEFAKIKFRTSSSIYEKASPTEIIDGFKELNTYFDFVRIIEVLAQSMLIKVAGRSDPSQIEPDVIDFLKICYWYNRLKDIPTIKHRRKEILSRLCQKLLHRLERRSKRSIDYSYLSENEIKKKINDTLNEIRRTQSTQNKNQTYKWLNEYLNFINVCISELIFPVLASESGFKIDFVPTNKDQGYDYDIIINGRPSQIKTLFSFEVFAIGEVEERKREAYIKGLNDIRRLYDMSQITMDLVEQEIISYVKHNCIGKINDALRQEAEVIIIDSTRTIPGLLQNYYYTDDTEYIKFHNQLIEVMNNSLSKFVYVLFASTTYDNKFRISSQVLKIPIIKINQKYQVDEMNKDKIYI